MSLKILVTGADGQLGSELRGLLGVDNGIDAVFTDIDTLDLCDAGAVTRFIGEGDFSHIVNCAAYTAVDRAEEQKIECTRANVDAVRNLAAAAAKHGVRLLHVSTDYVFDGNASTPYAESAKPAPASHYGATKRQGETALVGLLPDAVIIRTGWLYSSYGKNFVKTILAKLQKGEHLRVVADQIGTPTYAADLAAMIIKIIMTPWMPGTYHFSNEGVASWYDFAMAVAQYAGFENAPVVPVTSAEYVTAAKRPMYAVLDKSKIKATYNVKIAYWRDSLKLCMARIAAGAQQN